MDEQLTISTPEQVAFEYEVAGIGSRFVAALIDHLILGTTLFLILCAASVSQLLAQLGEITAEGSEFIGYLVAALLILIFFLVSWGYFVLFETIWSGQTPGKRAFRLRVIRRSGQPIRVGEALIRNLIRLVDFLPGFYGIGLISMFVDKDARRLGDFAAGTIVVREGHETTLKDVRVSGQAQPHTLDVEVPQGTMAASERAYYGAGWLEPEVPRTRPVVQNRYDPLPGVSLRDVTPTDFRLMRETLERVRRGELAADTARELATRLAFGVASRMGHDFREWQERGWEPVVFLESVLAAKDARD